MRASRHVGRGAVQRARSVAGVAAGAHGGGGAAAAARVLGRGRAHVHALDPLPHPRLRARRARRVPLLDQPRPHQACGVLAHSVHSLQTLASVNQALEALRHPNDLLFAFDSNEDVVHEVTVLQGLGYKG